MAQIKCLFLIVLFIIPIMSSSSEYTKFDWQASESAPTLYPMQIVSGNFLSQDGSSLYIPSGKTLLQGWGWPVSNHVVGPDLKSLPNKLEITFFSYFDDQFYSGSFDLPQDKILYLFRKGYFSPNENKHITYDAIVVGIAPGGTVAVWLSGIDKEKEIFFGKSSKVEGDWKWINNNPNYTRQEYIKLNIEDELKREEINLIKENGIPYSIWELYHKSRYNWAPVFKGIILRDKSIQKIKYYNGEEGYLKYPLDEDDLKESRAVPKEINFVWSYNEHKNYSYELYFDEKEMFDVFEKLGGNNEPLELEMKLHEKDNKALFAVSLKSKNDTVALKKFRLKTYGAN